VEIRQLRAFVAIAESGTFTAGALRVHVTQAAISMQIRQLETEIGAKVFVRAPRHVILTEAGEQLLRRARHILREHDAALDEIAELAGAERGRLRIGSASAMVLSEQLPAILKELRKQHPAAEISVTSGTSEVLVDQILGGEVDVAFVSLPVDVRGIKTERLSQDQLVAIASPRHKLAKQRTISAYTLAGERLILGERGYPPVRGHRIRVIVPRVADTSQGANAKGRVVASEVGADHGPTAHQHMKRTGGAKQQPHGGPATADQRLQA